jgi:Xaa-Pro aminopeptidase
VANPLSLALIQEFLPGGIETIEAETTAYVENHSRYLKEIREIIKKESLDSIGLTSVQYIDASEMCIRVENPIPYFAGIKTEEEIDLVRNSAAILKKVYAKINDMIYDGCGEIELRNLIDIELHNQGSEKRAFPTKVAFGKKTATIFPVSTMEKLKKNDIILIDMGGMYKGYITEMARTIFHGESDAQKKAIYEIVLSAYNRMKKFIKPGIVASAANAVVRDYFKEIGHEQYCYHPLGESTGFVKGGISLAPNDKNVLKSGMVFIVEPALYVPNWGGVKIKETILITDSGMEELSGGPE